MTRNQDQVPEPERCGGRIVPCVVGMTLDDPRLLEAARDMSAVSSLSVDESAWLIFQAAGEGGPVVISVVKNQRGSP